MANDTMHTTPTEQEINDIMAKYDRENALRKLPRALNLIVSLVLIAFSLLQLYSTWRVIPSTHMRPMHVAIVCFLAFALYPVKKGDFRSETGRRIGLIVDLLLSALALFVFLYQVVNFEAIAMQTKYTPFQYAIGAIGILLLLEACRRVAGLPIVCVACAFMLVGLFGQYMPGFLNNRGFSVERIIKQLFYTQNGVFGTPIGASSTFIFLFILFGAFLEKTGVGDFFIDFGNAVAGKKRGGPAKVAVLVSALEGTVSGSSVANTVGSGSVTIPLMKKTGYKPEFAAATEAAASTGGQIMPPIMGAAAFLMAEYVQEPYSKIVLRAILPAVLYFTGIFISVHLEAKKLGLKGLKKEDLPKLLPLLKKSYLLFPLLLLIYLVVTSTRSIQYAAAISIVACVLVSLFNKDSRITPKRFLEALAAGGQGTITVAAACGIAGIIAGTITMTGLASNIISGVVALAGGSVFLALLLTMICCIVLGMGIPTTATYCIMAATCAPILVQMGVPTVAAHFFVFYFGIVADLTPPVALAAYAGAAIAEASPMKTAVTATKLAIGAFIVPYAFAMSPAMLLIDTNILEVILICITAFIGICCISASLEGFLLEHMPWYERLLCLAGGLMLIIPGTATDLGGIALAAIVLALQFVARRRTPAAA